MPEPLLEPIFRKLRVGRIISRIPDNVELCDVGCGSTGELLNSIRDRLKKGYGFDRLVNNVNDSIITLKRLNLETEPIPLEDSSVNVVTAMAVLEHLEHPLYVLKQAYRILRPQGFLLLTTPAKIAKPVLEFLAFRLHIISKREIDEHKHYFNKGELKEILMEAGFSGDKLSISTFQFGFNNYVQAVK